MNATATDHPEPRGTGKTVSPWRGAALRAIFSAAILLLICNWHCIYEEDQMAKTAQILALGANSNWQHFATTTDYYTKDLFSAYYLVATAFYKITGLGALPALNLLSVGCGIIFFTVMPAFLKRLLNLPPWLSWCALMNAPILIISFTYGNEAALAVTATVLAAFALTFENVWARMLGAVFYVLAAYSRSDYLLVWPALAALTLARRDNAVDWKRSLRNVASFAAACAVLGIVYLALVLRHWPKPEYYESQSTLKLFAAYFVYSPGVTNFFFALVGFVLCVVQRRRIYFLLPLACLQFLPYVTHLDSPKYMLPTVVVMTVFATAGMLPLLQRAPWLLAALLAAPWFVSVTPYGIFGPARSVFWYVPTNDGPLPTGGYLEFYARVKEGFYQRRYDQELEQVGELMPVIESGPDRADVVGYFNMQTLRLWAARHQRWEIPPQDMPFWVQELDAHGTRRKFMIKTSYLYALKESPKLRAQLASALSEGRVQAAVAREADPFPDVIQVGPQVAADTDKELAARILFANAFYQNNQQMRREAFIKDFQGVSWIPRARFVKEGITTKPLYMDSEWVCLPENIPDAIYYSMRFPPIYSRSRKPLE